MMRHCMAPSEFTEVQTASLFGAIAEDWIGFNYLVFRRKVFFYPRSLTDYSDETGGYTNTMHYMAFLTEKHPQLKSRWGEVFGLVGGGTRGSFTKVPDLVTADGDIREFYEIKPNSKKGLYDGVKKISNIGALMRYLGLPYQPGERWKPNAKVQLYQGMMFDVEVTVFFHYFWKQPGLIVYDICVESRLSVESVKARLIATALVLVVVFGPEVLFMQAATAALPAKAISELAPIAARLAQNLRLIPKF